MKILNVGSIVIDHVYEVEHFVRPGETLCGTSYRTFAGGKGLNQSVALVRAGMPVHHFGKIGKDGDWLLSRLREETVNTTYVKVGESATGHAVIQVIPSGENAIILHSSANQTLSEADLTDAISSFSAGDYLLVQNETNLTLEAIRKGREHKLQVVFNPAPMSSAVHNYPLECVNIFILNEIEAKDLTGKTAPEDIRMVMGKRFPGSATVLTRGSQGAIYFDAKDFYAQPASSVEAVDTTAAGDTFIGFFLAEFARSGNPVKALSLGCSAAAICVTRAGALNSIPFQKELETFKSKD